MFELEKGKNYKFFVFSDVHGNFDALQEGLKRANFDPSNPTHILISCGDNFDRGIQNQTMVKWLCDKIEEKRLISIKGNHEDMLNDIIKTNYAFSADVSNGAMITLMQFEKGDDYIPSIARQNLKMAEINSGAIIKKTMDFRYFYKESCDYFETENYIFCHGYVPSSSFEGVAPSAIRSWEDARWAFGTTAVKNYTGKKTFVFGHFYAWLAKQKDTGVEPANEEKDKFYYAPHCIDIDCCTILTNKVNVLVVEDRVI